MRDFRLVAWILLLMLAIGGLPATIGYAVDGQWGNAGQAAGLWLVALVGIVVLRRTRRP